LPSDVIRELDLDPDQTVLDVMDARAYMRCKEAYDDGDEAKLELWLDTPLLEMVRENTFARVKQAFRKKVILTDDG